MGDAATSRLDYNAGVLELVDKMDSKSIVLTGVRVRVPPPAPLPGET